MTRSRSSAASGSGRRSPLSTPAAGCWSWVPAPAGVTALLAARAARVVAVDVSFDMLERARRRWAASGTSSSVLEDMRDLAFRVRFDLVVSADADGHLLTDADRVRTFACVARQLLPGGRFVLDAFWLPETESRPPPRAAACASISPPSPPAARGQVVALRSSLAAVHGALRVPEPGRRPVVAEFQARYWSFDELRARCGEAGLTIEAVWGDFDRAPWDERTSPRLIVQARGGEGPGRAGAEARDTRP